jgi:hypothetical protein
MPVSIAEQSEACSVYDCLNIEIAGSNPAQDMDVCLCVSVLCWTDPPTTESYQMCVWNEKSIKEGQDLIRTVEASGKKKNILPSYS